MLCVKCKKRTAVVFIQRMENGQPKQEGYCLTCARALGIKPVDDLMKQFGMRDEDLEAMEERMNSFMEEAGENGMSGMFPFAPMGEEEGDGKENDSDEEFTPGGSATFPFGFGAKGDKKKEKEKGPGKLKFLDKYCENLTARAAADEKPAFDFDTWVRAFAARKYESGFSREMSRSAAVYLKDFEGWDR